MTWVGTVIDYVEQYPVLEGDSQFGQASCSARDVQSINTALLPLDVPDELFVLKQEQETSTDTRYMQNTRAVANYLEGCARDSSLFPTVYGGTADYETILVEYCRPYTWQDGEIPVHEDWRHWTELDQTTYGEPNTDWGVKDGQRIPLDCGMLQPANGYQHTTDPIEDALDEWVQRYTHNNRTYFQIRP